MDKIKANLLFKKNITYNSLLSQNEANGFNKSNIINNPIKIIFKYDNEK